MTLGDGPRRPGPVFLGLGALAVLALVALGIWQVQRLAWKTALIARVEAGLVAPPAPAPGPQDWAGLTAADEYRRLSVTGRYLPGPQPLVRAVTRLGSGYWVMTPLREAGGWTLLVNRGFLPEAMRGAVPAPPEGPVTVEGLLRQSQPGGGFLRANDPGADRWFSRDVAALAAALDLPPPVAPWFLDAGTPGATTEGPGGDLLAGDPQAGAPLPGLTVVRFPNSHLSYALTWFTLAAGLAGMLVWLRLRRPGDGDPR